MKTLLLATFTFVLTFSFAQLTPSLDDVWIPMRDGQNLQADVYIPSGVDSAEVILIQTPYNKNLFSLNLPMGVGQNLDSQPFIWVIVDWRGFYGSAGAAIAQPNRGEDGYDVCEWIKDQAWHKDRIGTWGPSALGGVQYYTAREHHPNHTCAVPLVAHAHQSYDSYFTGGVLEKARLEQLDALGYGLSPLIMANTYYNNVWQFAESNSWFPPDIHIPTLQIGGWYDHNIDKMMEFYEACRNESDPLVQDEQWLLVGPWVHGGSGAAYVGSATQGELNYPNAEFKSDSMAWDFLNYYLLDASNNWENTDKITYYEMGTDQWATSNQVSIEEANTDVLYLSADGLLTSGTGAGTTAFVSDPHNPSPTIGGATLHTNLDQGPYDQISLESRDDIITFSSLALNQDVTISGRIKVYTHISADQQDCDISVRLVDVYPDGRNMLINDGIKRARFRNGYTQATESLMSPGNIYELEVELPFVHYTWKTGHQIKVYLGGNNAIRYDVNLQNGGAMYAAGDTNIANIHVYHDQLYPSRIELPGNNGFLSMTEATPNSLIIYPNPVVDALRIQGNSSFDYYVITDLNGRQVQQGEVKKAIAVERLGAGVYILNLMNEDKVIQQRFIK